MLSYSLASKAQYVTKYLALASAGRNTDLKKRGKIGDKPRWRFGKTFLIVTSTEEYTSIGTKSGKM